MIIPSSLYPAQTAADANYPQGRARNVTSSGSGDGTPLEQRWVNDLWGLCQALALETGTTPSGTPDNANTSQLRDAIKTLILRRQIAVYQIAGIVTGVAAGSPYVLSLVQQFGGYTLASNAVTVPAAGIYRVRFDCQMSNSGAANPQSISAGISKAGSIPAGATGNVQRFSASGSTIHTVGKEFILNITNPGTQPISLQSTDVNTTITDLSTFTIDRLS